MNGWGEWGYGLVQKKERKKEKEVRVTVACGFIQLRNEISITIFGEDHTKRPTQYT